MAAVRRRHLSVQEVETIFSRTGGRCYICKANLDRNARKAGVPGAWHVEHIISHKTCCVDEDLGDLVNSIDNLLPACIRCNLRKSDKPLVDFCTNSGAFPRDSTLAIPLDQRSSAAIHKANHERRKLESQGKVQIVMDTGCVCLLPCTPRDCSCAAANSSCSPRCQCSVGCNNRTFS